MAPRILLVAPPWRLPYTASLALGTLSPILRNAGYDVDELHGTVLFPDTASPFDFLEAYAKYLFVRELNDTPAEVLIQSLLRSLSWNATTRGARLDDETTSWSTLGIDGGSLEERFRRDLASAERCLDAMTERALAADYDIVGFSATFDSQVPASLALARRIRKARPNTKILLGGAACFEEQADGLLSSFPILDAVCHTEGEGVIVPLVHALRTSSSLAEVPGITWRDGNRIVHNPPPALLRNLDELPIPDYRGFLEAFHASHWTKNYEPLLMFETSRGCWWGQKKLCTFCGLNAEGIAFRAKTPERAYEEITRLYHDYPTATYLQATDNILDMKYLTTVFPRLHELARNKDRPLRMFYEVKSNMKAEHVRAMAAAGIDCVQPGIESFSDDVLQLMNKGCTGLGQVQFIKWTYQENIAPKYNILVGNPGEKAAWYDEMSALVPFLTHLPPPTGIVNMQLERFSPYFQQPEHHRITNIRPQSFYKELYPGERVDLDRIAYQFDFDHPDHHDAELSAAVRRFLDVAQQWRVSWVPGSAYYRFDDRGNDGESLLIVDRRSGFYERVDLLAGVRASLFLYLDQYRTRAQIGQHVGELDSTLVDVLLETWLHQRWICQIGDRYLSVLPRRGPHRGADGVVPPDESAAKPSKPRTLPMVA